MLKRATAVWLALAVLVAMLAFLAGRSMAPSARERAAPPTGAEPTPRASEDPRGVAREVTPPAGPAEPEAEPGAEEPSAQPDTARLPYSPEPPTPPEPTPWDAGQRPGTATPSPMPYDDEPATPVARPAEELATAFDLMDGFEDGNHWAVESAADHAVLALAEERVSQGQKSLKAAWKAFGKGNFELRREVRLDLTEARIARVDVYNEGGPLDLVLGIRAGQDASLFTTPPQPIETGWNRDVSFRLADLSLAEKGPWGTSWDWHRENVNRLSLIFRVRNEKEGVVHVDNLRFDYPAAKLGAASRPAIRRIQASAGTLDRFETLELAVDFDASYQDFFDRSEVDVVATFFAPSGKRTEVKGFVYEADEAARRPAWRVLFTPTEVGIWRYDVTVKSAGGDSTTQTYELLCRQGPPDRPGFIRVSKRDPLCFEFDSGEPYYPLGQNICWASNYEYYLDKMRAYGGNYVRVWLCPWNLQLELPTQPGKYDLEVARAIDRLLESCRERGIYVQLVLRYHGMHEASWDKSPYNAANGGPCNFAGDFFTDAKAKELHKRFLDYVAARWGHSPSLFAWELWNEVDLARADRESDVVAWHREMAAHLKKADGHGHLVTTSVCSVGKMNALFELAEIDFVPVHLYTRDLAAQFQNAWTHYRKLRKPVFIGEFSAGIRPGDDQGDERGVHLHAGLWLALASPFAGNAMPWWWDTFVDKNNLYHHWVVLGKFAEGIDRRGKGYEPVASQVKQGEDLPAFSLRGLVSPSEAILFAYDETRIVRPELAGRPLLLAERPVKLHGMLGGTFRVEVWDTIQGKVVSEATASSDGGTLGFTLPKSDHPLAVKVVHQRPAKPLPRVEW